MYVRTYLSRRLAQLKEDCTLACTTIMMDQMFLMQYNDNESLGLMAVCIAVWW